MKHRFNKGGAMDDLVVRRERTQEFDLEIVKNLSSEGEPRFIGFYMEKVPGGIRYVVSNDAVQPSLRQFRAWCKGRFVSPRPYQPGQTADGSDTDCALALFANWARACEVDPVSLLRQAYPEEGHEFWTDETLRRFTEFADWQGVAYPSHWDEPTTDRMLDALANTNYHCLRIEVERVMTFEQDAAPTCGNSA